MEIWKPIENYEGLYEISSCGRIKSCARVLNYNNGTSRKTKEHIMTPDHSKAYERIRLCKHNKQKRFMIHRLVASAFIPNPHNLPIINHIDGVKTNNNVNNLEWCTHSHNNKEAYRLGLKKYTEKNREILKKAIKSSCKEVWQLSNDREKIKKYPSCYEAERQLGLSRGCIHQAIKNNNRAGNYYWAFAKTPNATRL